MTHRFCLRHGLAGAVAGLWLVALLTGWLVQPSTGARIARAAPEVLPPSGPLAHFGGTLAVGEQVTPQLPLPGILAKNLNLRLAVQGTSGTLDLAVTTGKGANAFSGRALAGDLVWAPITLDAGPNVFALKNTGAAPLTYDLIVLEPGSTPFDWAGVSQSGSTWKSGLTLLFPADGLYRFDFDPGGRYLLTVGDNHLARVIESSGSQVFYVPPGEQTLTLMADPAATVATQWSLHVVEVGPGSDSLPYAKAGGHLWGDKGTFHEEWLPMRLAAPVEANFQFRVTGASGDAIDVSFVKGGAATTTEAGPRVYGGETVWRNVQLPAGTTRVHLTAAPGNSGSLAYDFQAVAAPSVPASWSGTSNAAGDPSKVHFSTPASGLYRFNYGVTMGRYQLVIDSDTTPSAIKTVESPGETRYYLAAGTHQLTVRQDSRVPATAWSLEVAASGEMTDTLPLTRSGGHLGGMGNDFRMERLPLFVSAAGAVNISVTASGDRTDRLRAGLYRPSAAGPVAESTARGGETVWWTAELVQGLNWIDLAADDINNGPLDYALTVAPVPSIRYTAPFTWSGISAREGVNSRIRVQTLVGGVYHILAVMPQGFANVIVTPATAQPFQAQSAVVEYDLPLDAGTHEFRVEQSTQLITTTWTVTVTLQDALAPKITSRTPITAVNDADNTITIEGENFQPEASVRAGNLTLRAVKWLDAQHLTVQIPARQPTGLYDLTVTNPDGQSVTVRGGIQILRGKALLYYFPRVAQRAR